MSKSFFLFVLLLPIGKCKLSGCVVGVKMHLFSANEVGDLRCLKHDTGVSTTRSYLFCVCLTLMAGVDNRTEGDDLKFFCDLRYLGGS